MALKRIGPLAVFGGGNMGLAIIRGAAATGVLRACDVVVCEPLAAQRRRIRALGVRAVSRPIDAVSGSCPIVLAVKPHVLPALAEELRPVLDRSPRLVLSILAGTPARRVAELLGARVRVARIMPNTPAQIGMGMAAVCPGPGCRPADLRFAERLFGSIGQVIRIDESLMDSFTAVAGSGPAYVYFLAEAMIRAAVAQGFTAAAADRIVRQTVAGAGRMLAESAAVVSDLREAVTSKRGTTAAAIAVLDAGEVGKQLELAISAARRRGGELARESDRPAT